MGVIAFIFILIIGGSVCLIFSLTKRRRCRWCMVSTVKVEDLSEPERSQASRVIEQEDMSREISFYEVCPNCKKIFDWRWFDDERPDRRDWDMHDRQCACGVGLKRPSAVPSSRLREAFEDILPEVMHELHQKYSEEELGKKIYSQLSEDHIFFVCARCRRVYMWKPLEGYEVFQCVSKQYDRYDPEPGSRF